MVIGTFSMPLSPDRRADLLEMLQSIQEPVLAQPGCKGFHIYEEQCSEPVLVLIERWDSMAALENHIRSKLFRLILNALDLSCGQPDVCVEHVCANEGMELIQRLRSQLHIAQ